MARIRIHPQTHEIALSDLKDIAHDLQLDVPFVVAQNNWLYLELHPGMGQRFVYGTYGTYVCEHGSMAFAINLIHTFPNCKLELPLRLHYPHKCNCTDEEVDAVYKGFIIARRVGYGI